MMQTGKAYLLSTYHSNGTIKYVLLEESLSNSSFWVDTLADLNNISLNYSQDIYESTIEELLANLKHLTLCAEVTLPFCLDNHPELLI